MFVKKIVVRLNIIITIAIINGIHHFLIPSDLSVSECFISIMLSTIMIMPIGILIIAAIEVGENKAKIPKPVEITPITSSKYIPPSLSTKKEIMLNSP